MSCRTVRQDMPIVTITWLNHLSRPNALDLCLVLRYNLERLLRQQVPAVRQECGRVLIHTRNKQNAGRRPRTENIARFGEDPHPAHASTRSQGPHETRGLSRIYSMRCRTLSFSCEILRTKHSLGARPLSRRGNKDSRKLGVCDVSPGAPRAPTRCSW